MAPVYTCGYTDMIDCIGTDGCVSVPSGVGLGVKYNWDFIKSNTTKLSVFE
jgi:L-alanine-DL-glutamate epimerase-like enolase superfamily enzyme